MSTAAIRPYESVLEIGTGRGAITVKLARLGASFEAYEVDEENRRATLALLGEARADVRAEDAFAQTRRFDVLVSSLPYSESARFVEWISRADYDRAVVVLQEDFVKKVMAPAGTRNYRAVSAIAQISSEVEIAMRVERRSFQPPPKVNSLVVSFRPRRKVTKAEADLVKRLFSLRRRKLAAAAPGLGLALDGWDFGDRRVYSLTPDEIVSHLFPMAARADST